MGLRLGSSINSKRNGPGFELKFTENRTYNLDELVELRNRVSSTAALVIEVKNEEAIAKKVLEKLIEDTTSNIITSLSEHNDGLKKQISQIIRETYKKYQLDIIGTSNPQIKDKITTEISARVDRYLKFILDTNSVQFTVFAEDNTGESFVVGYDFSSKDAFRERFVTYYTKYANDFNKELSVNEGGLAISNTASKIRVNRLDYEKYLLNEKKPTPVYQNSDLSNSKPIINWVDGSEPSFEDIENAQITDVTLNYSTIKNTVLDGSCTVSNIGKSPESIATIGYVDEKIGSIEGFATINYVDEEINKVVGDAKESLDTLKELSDAIGEDPNFVKSITTAINEKASKEYVDKGLENQLNQISNISNALNTKAEKLDLDNLSKKVSNIEVEYAKKEELFSRDYNDLLNKPEIPSIEGLASEKFVEEFVENYYIEKIKNDISNLYAKLEAFQGGDITNSELDTLKEISERIESLTKSPIILDDPELEL